MGLGRVSSASSLRWAHSLSVLRPFVLAESFRPRRAELVSLPRLLTWLWTAKLAGVGVGWVLCVSRQTNGPEG